MYSKYSEDGCLEWESEEEEEEEAEEGNGKGLGTVGKVTELGHLMTFQKQVPFHYSFICPQSYSENRFYFVTLQKQKKKKQMLYGIIST